MPQSHPILFSTPMIRALLDGRKTQTRRTIKPQPRTWRCPYGKPGDLLWVRETIVAHEEHGANEGSNAGGFWPYYAADCTPVIGATRHCVKTIPSIFMPREYSRLTLEIVDIRVQRLQEIQEAEAIAEGVTIRVRENGALSEFRSLWESINGKGSWAANSWVWALTFQRTT